MERYPSFTTVVSTTTELLTSSRSISVPDPSEITPASKIPLLDNLYVVKVNVTIDVCVTQFCPVAKIDAADSGRRTVSVNGDRVHLHPAPYRNRAKINPCHCIFSMNEGAGEKNCRCRIEKKSLFIMVLRLNERVMPVLSRTPSGREIQIFVAQFSMLFQKQKM